MCHQGLAEVELHNMGPIACAANENSDASSVFPAPVVDHSGGRAT